VQALRQGSWWSATGWIFILALAVRPVAGNHHESGHSQSGHHNSSHGSLGPAGAAGAPTETPVPEQDSPDRTQPCPCASSCSASGAASSIHAAPSNLDAAPPQIVFDARLTARVLTRAVRFRLPLANAPPLPGVLFTSI